MKTLYLLCAIAYLVSHVQANPEPLSKDVPQDEPEALDAVADDGIGMEDAEAAEDPDAQASPRRCHFAGGVCKRSWCGRGKRILGLCSSDVLCCSG